MDETLSLLRRRKTGRPRTAADRVGQQLTDELDAANATADLIAPLPPSNELQHAGANELQRLHAMLGEVTPERHPRTARLLVAGTRKAAQKVIEEAGEVALHAAKHSGRGVVRTSADLLYHLVVLWRHEGVDPVHVWTEMRRRADAFGIAEKLPKSRHRNPPASYSDR